VTWSQVAVSLCAFGVALGSSAAVAAHRRYRQGRLPWREYKVALMSAGGGWAMLGAALFHPRPAYMAVFIVIVWVLAIAMIRLRLAARRGTV
jgi:hypothetical protein